MTQLTKRTGRLTMLLIAGLLLLPAFLMAQKQGTFKDARDSQDYHWLKIGSQVWMTGNLRYEVPAGSWAFNNDSANEQKFGRLYTWKAAQTACPKGWHLPSEKEWNVLVLSLGGAATAGERMQQLDTVGMNYNIDDFPPSNVISTLLSGVRHPDGSCIGINVWGGLWSSGSPNDSTGTNVLFANKSKEISFSTNDKNSGFSVRCIRNK